MLQILLLFIFIIILSYFVIYAKTYIHLLEPYENIGDNLYNSKMVNRYINNIHHSQYKNKLPTKNWNFKGLMKYKRMFFKKFYIKSLVTMDSKFKTMFKTYLDKIKIIFRQTGLNNLNNNNWQFIMSINKLEDGMPYTIDKYIVFNKDRLLSELESFNKDGINMNLLETIIHEMMHILQRYNQTKFNHFYRDTYQFLGRSIPLEQLPKKIKKRYMTNPDSNFLIWIYKYKNNSYFPILSKKGYSYEDIGINTRSGKTIRLDNMRVSNNFSKYISFYHPNEIFACYVSALILKRQSNNSYIRFLKKI